MARRFYSSIAVATTLAADLNNVSTTVQVTDLTGFPASTPFTIIVDQDEATEEVMEVSNVAGTVLTVARGVDGTDPVAHTAGAIVRHGVSARDFNEANEHVNDSSTDVHSQYVLKSLATTAGDMFVRNSSGVTRLPVGSSGQVLTVDDAEPTKVKWDTPSSVSPGDTIPTGTLMPYVGDTAPTGWLLCQGQELSSTSYPALSTLCSTKFGTAAAGFFKLPDLRGRTIFGLLSTDNSFNALGKSGGSGAVTLTTSQLPAHTHSTPAHDHTASTSGLTASSAGDHTHTITSSTATTGAHTHSYTDTTHVTQSNYDRTGGGTGATAQLTTSPGNSRTTGSSGAHTHTVSSSASTTGSHTHSISGSVTVASGGASTTGSTGSGSSVNVLNPFVTLNFIIKAA